MYNKLQYYNNNILPYIFSHVGTYNKIKNSNDNMMYLFINYYTFITIKIN